MDTTRPLLAHPGAQARDGLRARGLFNAGQLAAFMGHHAEAQSPLLECLAIARETGDAARVAAVLQPLAMVAIGLGDLAAARHHIEDAVAAARALGDPRQLAGVSRWPRSIMAGRLGAALDSYAEALQLARGFGDLEYEAAALLNLAMVHLMQGACAPAAAQLRDVIGIVAQIGSRPAAAIGTLDVATGVAVQVGDMAQAARCHGLAEGENALSGIRRDAADEAFLARFLAQARAALGNGFDEAAQTGRAAGFDAIWSDLLPWLAALPASA